MPPSALLTRDQIAQRICQGQILFIYQKHVVNATKWAPLHPGGNLALLHFVGRDATDEVDAYHSEQAKQRMLKMVVGHVQVDEATGWRPLTPPIALGFIQRNGKWTREGDVRLGSGLLFPTPEALEPTSDMDATTEKMRSKAYRDLRSRIEDAGLFRRPGPLAGYGSDILRYVALGSAAFGLHL